MAEGKNALLLGMPKCCGASLLDNFEQVFNQVWKHGCIPQEWKDAIIVPIPKKDNLSIM